MFVCVSQLRQYTCRAKRVTTWTSTIHTKSIKNQRPIFNYQIYNKNTQSKRYITRYVVHIEKETEPIHLLKDWWRGIENMENMRICVWTLWFRKGFRQERQWIVTNVRGKNWKHLKIDLYVQNTRFSRLNQVASKSPEHSRQKFWKIYLSVFHDWKFYPQESHEVSRENLWALSRLDLPPANKSQDWVARNIKNPNFEKYSKYFSRLGQWPASELRKISVWARAWDMRLD